MCKYSPDVDGLVDEDVREPNHLVVLVLDQHQVLLRVLEDPLPHAQSRILPVEPEKVKDGMTEEDSQSEKENLRVTSRVICCICSSTPKMFLRFMTPLMSSGAPDNLGGMSECQLSGNRKTTSVAEGSCRSRPPGQGGFDYQPPSQAYGRAGKCSQWFATSSH